MFFVPHWGCRIQGFKLFHRARPRYRFPRLVLASCTAQLDLDPEAVFSIEVSSIGVRCLCGRRGKI